LAIALIAALVIWWAPKVASALLGRNPQVEKD
jgi:hypothetical protein